MFFYHFSFVKMQGLFKLFLKALALIYIKIALFYSYLLQ